MEWKLHGYIILHKLSDTFDVVNLYLLPLKEIYLCKILAFCRTINLNSIKRNHNGLTFLAKYSLLQKKKLLCAAIQKCACWKSYLCLLFTKILSWTFTKFPKYFQNVLVRKPFVGSFFLISSFVANFTLIQW